MAAEIELALTPDARWSAGIGAVVRAAAAAGFSAVGLPVRSAGPEASDAFAGTGLRCHELLALVITADVDATLRFAARMAQAAEGHRAEWVLTTFGVPLSPEAIRLTTRCAAMIGEVGCRMAVEFTPLGGVRTLSEGLQMATAVGTERAALVIDSWHFCRGPNRWEDLHTVPLEQIAYLQFTDAAEPVSDDGMRETMDRRLMPGEGVLELERFATTLLDRGWRGLVSVEVLNSDLARLPVDEFARRAYESTRRYWN